MAGLVTGTHIGEEPVSLAEAKAQCRVTFAEDDGYLTALVAAARAYIEASTGLVLRAGWRTQYTDGFPAGNRAIEVPVGPVSVVTRVRYLCAGAWVELDGTDYHVDLYRLPARIVPVQTWPRADRGPNTVEVCFAAGYGEGRPLPEYAKAGILMLVAHWYANRESASEKQVRSIPEGVPAIMRLLAMVAL